MLKTPLKKKSRKKKWWRKYNRDRNLRLKDKKYSRQYRSRRNPQINENAIKVPKEVCFHQNLEETLNFFNNLRDITDKRKFFKIIFKDLSYISAEASLILVSEVDRFRRLRKSKIRLSNTKNWKEHIKIQFNEIGMFELLDINHCPKDVRKYKSEKINSDVTFLKFTSGETAETQKRTEIITPLVDLIKENMSGKKHLERGLSEAMTNIVQHAYPNDFIEKSIFKCKKWWVSASFDKNDSILTFMIYDQGKTIPATFDSEMVDESKFLNRFKHPFDRKKDSHMIRAAVETHKSSTKKINRGKGLRDIKKYAENASKGELMIISRKGCYSYKKKMGSKTKELPIPLNGTLISWKGCMDGTNIDKALYKRNKRS